MFGSISVSPFALNTAADVDSCLPLKVGFELSGTVQSKPGNKYIFKASNKVFVNRVLYCFVHPASAPTECKKHQLLIVHNSLMDS